MKSLFATLALFTLPLLSFAAPVDGTFGLHLFFDEKEFVDVLILRTKGDGTLSGHMSVPNDFEGEIQEIHLIGDRISFDLPVPKNAARPQDLLFHYEGTFFPGSRDQFNGFVTLKAKPGFVASFVAFRRKGE